MIYVCVEEVAFIQPMGNGSTISLAAPGPAGGLTRMDVRESLDKVLSLLQGHATVVPG